jgi:hypothetical protein
MAINFENLGARQNFVSKDVQNYFSKDYDAQKYFWNFYEKRKSARKDSSMQGCFENLNMQWEKPKSQEKQNGGK